MEYDKVENKGSLKRDYDTARTEQQSFETMSKVLCLVALQ